MTAVTYPAIPAADPIPSADSLCRSPLPIPSADPFADTLPTVDPLPNPCQSPADPLPELPDLPDLPDPWPDLLPISCLISSDPA